MRHIRSVSRQISTKTVSLLPSVIEQDEFCREQKRNARSFEEIPGPSGLPYLGTLFTYTKGQYSPSNYHQVLLNYYKKYGPIFKETMAGNTVVHLFHPELIKTMYSNEGRNPFIPPLLETTQTYRQCRDMSPGLGNSNGEEWYRLRKSVHQLMLRSKPVTMFLPHVNQVADEFVCHIQKIRDPNTGEVTGLSDEISKWVLQSSARICFEKDLQSFDDADPQSFANRMIQANVDIFNLALQLKFSIPLHKVFPSLSKTWKRLMKSEDFFFSNGQKLVDEAVFRINQLAKQDRLQENQFGFLRYLLGREELTYKEISILTMSLFNDGLSSTSPNMSGQLFCLASNPVKQDKLYQEICELTSDPSDPITSEVINKGTYLKACIKEGLRFFPVGSEISRITQKPIVLGGYEIPAGVRVDLNNNLLLRLPEYIEDPERYCPERWIRGKSTAQRVHPYLLLPFGFGPRICAGRRFAEQDLSVMLIKLLQHYKLEWPHTEKMGQKYNMLMTTDMACRVKLIPRV